MYSATLLLVLCLASFEATIAAPARYLSPNRCAFTPTLYGESQCSQQSETYQRNAPIQEAPSMSEYTESQAPLLRQVFTTVTRKHDNLNTAQANNKKALDIKYQAGPSIEAEGTVYAKQKGSVASGEEHEDQDWPFMTMEPTQEVQ